MDFNTLLSQEIEKKRKLADSKGTKLRFKKKKVQQTQTNENEPLKSRKIDQNDQNDQNDQFIQNEINNISKVTHNDKSSLAMNELPNELQDVDSWNQNSQLKVNKDERSGETVIACETVKTVVNGEKENGLKQEITTCSKKNSRGHEETVESRIIDEKSSSIAVDSSSESMIDKSLDQHLAKFNIVNENSSKQEKIDKLRSLLKIEKYKQYLSQEIKYLDSPLISLDINLENVQVLSIKIRIYLKNLIKSWELTNVNLDLLHEIKVDIIDLLYKLRKQKLPSDMIISLSTIIHYLNLHEFNQANQAYLKLSIGNVAWPIGIRNIGIHERAADRKLVSKSANIMINDKTRRWIVSIKRMITWCENTLKS